MSDLETAAFDVVAVDGGVELRIELPDDGFAILLPADAALAFAEKIKVAVSEVVKEQ